MSTIPKTTHAYPFFSCNPQGTALFSVRPGVSSIDALQLASCFLTSARDAAYGATEHTDSSDVFAAAYLIDMAQAVVDAAIAGMIGEKNAARSD